LQTTDEAEKEARDRAREQDQGADESSRKRTPNVSGAASWLPAAHAPLMAEDRDMQTADDRRARSNALGAMAFCSPHARG